MSVAILERPSADTALEADLNFLVAGTSVRPRSYTFEPPAGEPRVNYAVEPHRVRIHDLRRIAGEASLDREGFALIEQHSAVTSFTDDAQVEATGCLRRRRNCCRAGYRSSICGGR